MKQCMMNAAGSGIGRGVQDEQWENRYQFDCTKLGNAPVPFFGISKDNAPFAAKLGAFAASINELARLRAASSPEEVLGRWDGQQPLEELLAVHRELEAGALALMCGLQEEVDWLVYDAFGLLEDGERDSLDRVRAGALTHFPLRIDQQAESVHRCGLRPGHRPFEIELAGRTLRSGTATAWFDRNRYASRQGVTDSYCGALQGLLEARVQIIRANPRVRVIEQPEYKHRWAVRDWDAEVKVAATDALADALEAAVKRHSAAAAASGVGRVLESSQFRGFGLLLGKDLPTTQVANYLLAGAAVPFLSALRLTPAGLKKRAAWEHTWSLQRREDAGEQVGDIPVPPKYDHKDFRDPIYWRLRGKLDVPKERFISYPGCESDEDHEPVYGWAGWNHLEQAQALSALYQDRKTREGWGKERLTPMLAGLLELIPWVKQWHNEPSAEYDGRRLGDFFEIFLAGECSALGLTEKDLRDWRPADKKAGRGRKKAKPADAPAETPKDEEES
jgi:hypothetical protein